MVSCLRMVCSTDGKLWFDLMPVMRTCHIDAIDDGLSYSLSFGICPTVLSICLVVWFTFHGPVV